MLEISDTMVVAIHRFVTAQTRCTKQRHVECVEMTPAQRLWSWFRRRYQRSVYTCNPLDEGFTFEFCKCRGRCECLGCDREEFELALAEHRRSKMEELSRMKRGDPFR